jgi:hypothetical protein
LVAQAPTPTSYWVVPGRLLAGCYPEDAAALAAAGVTRFLDLTEEGQLAPYVDGLGSGVRWRRFPIRDLGVPTEAELVGILDAIDDGLARGETVYVHCAGGLGRTGTVVACHLVRHGAAPEEALRRVAASIETTEMAGRDSPETDEQMALVRSWRAGR